eukprot:CAMPEP_0115141286 /NCGR_PEP_ID=MMETSP0227-20121206/59449_1 /TAXON_ID=89957 /ORGANISM="Polarella glacialis, Strain CCMP 1383" /LENGTH=113 /DNA_ID=CAMNT_0002549623 /DNA_START=149 /DNA_END=490 /DNA_ORIENTATION=+
MTSAARRGSCHLPSLGHTALWVRTVTDIVMRILWWTIGRHHALRSVAASEHGGDAGDHAAGNTANLHQACSCACQVLGPFRDWAYAQAPGKLVAKVAAITPKHVVALARPMLF